MYSQIIQVINEKGKYTREVHKNQLIQEIYAVVLKKISLILPYM